MLAVVQVDSGHLINQNLRGCMRDPGVEQGDSSEMIAAWGFCPKLLCDVTIRRRVNNPNWPERPNVVKPRAKFTVQYDANGIRRRTHDAMLSPVPPSLLQGVVRDDVSLLYARKIFRLQSRRYRGTLEKLLYERTPYESVPQYSAKRVSMADSTAAILRGVVLFALVIRTRRTSRRSVQQLILRVN